MTMKNMLVTDSFLRMELSSLMSGTLVDSLTGGDGTVDSMPCQTFLSSLISRSS